MEIEIANHEDDVFEEKTKKMDPDIKARWVKALKSGEYEQGQGSLNEKDKYCCLGVLCDLYVKENPDHPWADGEYAPEKGLVQVEGRKYLFGQGSFLPPLVEQWAGLSHGNDVIFWDGDAESHDGLVDMNDNGSDFNQIAEVIEKWL